MGFGYSRRHLLEFITIHQTFNLTKKRTIIMEEGSVVMRIGINSAVSSVSGYCRGYVKHFGEDTYKKMKEFGFSCVDNGVLTVDPAFYKADAETQQRLLLREKALADEAGICIHQEHGPILSSAHAVPEEEIAEFLEKMKVAIESCTILGCEYLVLHPLMVNGWSDRGTVIAKDTIEKNINHLRTLGDYAKQYGITLCLENLPCVGFCISTPEDVLSVVKAVDHDNVKICIDTGHITAFSSQLKVGEEIRKCGDLIKVLHVHDNHGRADQHNFPGMGMIDWTDVMAALREIGFDGVFSLEVVHPDRFSKPIFEHACRLSFEMANEIANGV